MTLRYSRWSRRMDDEKLKTFEKEINGKYKPESVHRVMRLLGQTFTDTHHGKATTEVEGVALHEEGSTGLMKLTYVRDGRFAWDEWKMTAVELDALLPKLVASLKG